MSNVENAVKQLSEAIRVSEEYLEYHRQLDRVKEFPELKAQIDEFRARNFAFQTSQNPDFRKLEEFEQEYADFRENPYVSDFLAAELAFCRMMQDINIRITESVNFE